MRKKRAAQRFIQWFMQRVSTRKFRFLCGCLAGFSVFWLVGLTQVGYTQSDLVQPNLVRSDLIQAGLAQYHQGDFSGAIAQWQQYLSTQSITDPATDSTASTESLAADPDSISVRKYLARAYQQLGQTSEALEALDPLLEYYQQTDNILQRGQILTEQAQLYGELGQPQNALSLLCGEQTLCVEEGSESSSGSGEDYDGGSLAIARQYSDLPGEAAALGVLGQTYYLQGNYEQAVTVLTASSEIATAINSVPYQIATTNTLGNVHTSLSQRSSRYAQFAKAAEDASETARLVEMARAANQQAIEYFNQGLELARSQGDAVNIVRSQLNLVLPTYRQTAQSSETAQSLLITSQNQLKNLPDSQEKAYHAIRIANLLGQIQQPANAVSDATTASVGFSECTPLAPSSVEVLQEAVAISRRINNPVAESFAVGSLGHLYECASDYEAAKQLTERAQLLTAQPATQYLWEWQAGRIFAAQGLTTEAIAHYESTVKTLEQVQGDIAIANRELRLDFRDAVEGIYRQLTELHLAQAMQLPHTKQSSVSGDNALSALYTLDGLRLAELRNYLGSECDLPLALAPSQSLRPTTATLSTLILDNQLAVILALPDASGNVQPTVNMVPLTKAELTEQINDFRYRLEQRSDRSNRYLERSQQIYDWLIRPFEPTLTANNIQSLVFNHDGILRMVPMAALHDGKQFLVESYAVSNSPSFAAATAPTASDSRLQVLAFGLSDVARVSPTEQFSPLDSVAIELAQIEATVPKSTVFLNEEFTTEKLQETLETEPFSVLHLATHAQFGYDASDTFLVTGEKVSDNYNQPLRLNRLYRLLQQTGREQPPLQMLALTACETAVGSERDALGIAGVALQAGVKSAVASLWQVEDQAVAELITRFYGHLQDGLSRSAALQLTQREWLDSAESYYQHPGYWAGLILVEAGVETSL